MKKHTLKSWITATRPWSFTASGLTVLTCLVYLWWLNGEVDWTNGLGAVVGIILFHAAGNTWSDYFDYRSGVDTVEGAYGADNSLVRGLFTPREIRNLALGLLVVAVVVGLWLLLRTRFALFWIGLAGVVCTLGYPALKYRALGDLDILLAYGFLPAIGTSLVALGEVDWHVLWMALPVGLLTDSILHANNTRDMASDCRARICTMAQGLGLRGSVVLYVCEVLLPFMWVVVLIPFRIFPFLSLLLFLAMRVALRNSATMREFRDDPRAEVIASLDRQSAFLQMLFCLLMAGSLALDVMLR